MLATSSRQERKAGIHIGTGTRFGLAGAFDRYLRLPLPWTMSIAQRIYHPAAVWAGLANRMKIRECGK
jgi:hypothetical protein